MTMQFGSLKGRRALISFLAVAFSCWYPPARAQTLTTGAIAGVVKDPSGAVVPNAELIATNFNTGGTRTTKSGDEGTYLIPQLNPGNYKLTVKASGFATEEHSPITVPVGHTVGVDFSLKFGVATEIVEVVGAASLIERSNPNTTTTLTATELAQIPNPGNDLTYVANFAPGAVMSFGNVYGNVEFNGLPGTANNFTIDGLDANDAFYNVNISGATNLQLGLDAMAAVSINTNSYSVDQGRQSAAQINYVTKSGTQKFHGKAQETWNGSALNATDFF